MLVFTLCMVSALVALFLAAHWADVQCAKRSALMREAMKSERNKEPVAAEVS